MLLDLEGGAVEDYRHRACAFGANPLRDERAHSSRAEHQHRAPTECSQSRLRKLDRGARVADRLRADPGLRTRHLPGSDREAEEIVQDRAERARLLGLDVCLFDLAENLRFADEHRVEARAHAEEMVDGLAAEERVQVRVHVAHVGVPEILEEALDLRDARLVVLKLGVDLQTVAGLQHQRFADRLVIAQRDEGLAHLRSGERVALADLNGSRVVRESDADYGHGASLMTASPPATRRALHRRPRGCGRHPRQCARSRESPTRIARARDRFRDQAWRGRSARRAPCPIF